MKRVKRRVIKNPPIENEKAKEELDKVREEFDNLYNINGARQYKKFSIPPVYVTLRDTILEHHAFIFFVSSAIERLYVWLGRKNKDLSVECCDGKSYKEFINLPEIGEIGIKLFNGMHNPKQSNFDYLGETPNTQAGYIAGSLFGSGYAIKVFNEALNKRMPERPPSRKNSLEDMIKSRENLLNDLVRKCGDLTEKGKKGRKKEISIRYLADFFLDISEMGSTYKMVSFSMSYGRGLGA